MVSPSTKRRAVKAVIEEGVGTTAEACRALGLARSSYYRNSAVRLESRQMHGQIVQLSQDHPRYGYRRVTALLRREGHEVNGKAPTVQTWCPRSVQMVEQAAKECPCQFKDGQKLVVEFDLMEPNGFDAKNGVIIRAGSVLPLE